MAGAPICVKSSCSAMLSTLSVKKTTVDLYVSVEADHAGEYIYILYITVVICTITRVNELDSDWVELD